MSEFERYRKFMSKAEMQKSLNSLYGILTGIAADGFVSNAEQDEVQNWYALHECLLNVHPFNEILPVISDMLADNKLDIDEVEAVIWLCDKFINDHGSDLYFDYITSQIQRLEGTLHGIISDGNISDFELTKLNDWLNDNDNLSGVYPFDEVYSLLLAAKEDGVITQEERNKLRAFFATFVDTRESFNIHEKDVADLRKEYSIGGICAVCPVINIEGNTFCFTGASKKATRSEIAAIIEDHGGTYNDRVTAKTNYLIVGADGNPCWTFSCYGRKVEKAVELRKSGKSIIIVHEYDFWDELA